MLQNGKAKIKKDKGKKQNRISKDYGITQRHDIYVGIPGREEREKGTEEMLETNNRESLQINVCKPQILRGSENNKQDKCWRIKNSI